MSCIYILHENDEWTVHLTDRLEELGLPYETWHLRAGSIDLSETPPEGIFYNRMSASSHTRDHRFAPEYTSAVLAWLERHGRVVVNGSRALALEINKAAQYMALETEGIETPKTIVASGNEELIEAADRFTNEPFITKHNRAGKGLGVQLFKSKEALATHAKSASFEPSIDGLTLLQAYIESPESYITRCEFIGGKFLYAVRVDTSEGFELCPAEACRIDDLACPAPEAEETAAPLDQPPMFQMTENVDPELIEKYERLLRSNDIQVAGIEFIRNAAGEVFTYDINTNTNYNPEAEAKAGTYGMLELAQYLGRLLAEHTQVQA
ncbi:ATP-grasp domain-containing protein [Salsuginibacillus kocurii]|uniref:ATP-grasp domain-containing protein n=1 Tax=Salsuginibacillus kocurii TaxID=427078 RepID=UPI00036430E9|nr:hypothetical protein [Salsuginibacillus kocurii]